MMTDASEAVGVARRYTRAVNARDTAALAEVYAGNATIWHTNTGRDVPVSEELDGMGQLFEMVHDFRLEDARPQATATGFVQQHVARGTAPGGALEVPVCIVATVRNGRVERMEGYLDPAPMNAVMPTPPG